MIKFKKRTYTNKIIVVSTYTGEVDYKIRDLRQLVKEEGALEVKANFVITKSGEIETARHVDEVSGFGVDSIVILLVGSPECISEEQLSGLNTLLEQLQILYPTTVVENEEISKRIL
ncbi:TPA: hypothetical protein ACQ317_004168 [Yersinia enterocolitica]